MLEGAAVGSTALAPEVPDLPQLQGAYQDPYRTDEAVKPTCGLLAVPALHRADCSGLLTGGEGRLAVRGSEENYQEILALNCVLHCPMHQ